MSLLFLSFNRHVVLLLLLVSAAPLRPAPVEAEAELGLGAEMDTDAEADTAGLKRALAAWNWPLERAKSTYRYRDFLDNGSPLPKTKTEEMVSGLGDVLMQPFNFPPLPLHPSSGRWNHWQQRTNKHLNQLQVHRGWSWLGEPQSPAAAKLKRDAYDMTKEYHKWKRAPDEYKGSRYRPSISAGVMTNLGDFFKQLKANVHFAEHSQQLGAGESQLLEGLHPYAAPDDSDVEVDPNDIESEQSQERNPSKLLQSVRSYRPSQKIRSLVSRNPSGYRGSQFIDPSYMWLGLGK